MFAQFAEAVGWPKIGIRGMLRDAWAPVISTSHYMTVCCSTSASDVLGDLPQLYCMSGLLRLAGDNTLAVSNKHVFIAYHEAAMVHNRPSRGTRTMQQNAQTEVQMRVKDDIQ